MTVVSNAGPIIALSQIGRLDFLHLQDDTVFIPPAVYTELIRCKAKVDATPWIEVHLLRDSMTVEVLRERLDAGESEAIALAMELSADTLIIDEARGRRVAESRGLGYIGTLGLVILAKKRRVITAVKPIIAELQDAGFYMSKELHRAVLALADEQIS
jgi:predicted nucleic acid-binding protein